MLDMNGVCAELFVSNTPMIGLCNSSAYSQRTQPNFEMNLVLLAWCCLHLYGYYYRTSDRKSMAVVRNTLLTGRHCLAYLKQEAAASLYIAMLGTIRQSTYNFLTTESENLLRSSTCLAAFQNAITRTSYNMAEADSCLMAKAGL